MNRYSAIISEHFQDPRNEYVMAEADTVGVASMGGRPPIVTIYLRLQDVLVQKASFQASGCGFLMACCSALTELIRGKSAVECGEITPEGLIELLDGLPPDKRFCAFLAAEALRDAVRKVVERKSE